MVAFIFLLLIHLILPIKPDGVVYKGNTALAIKQTIKEYRNPIFNGSRYFKELVLNSKIFIDNTLFCLKILQKSTTRIRILSPSQWGKTTLLTMLKTYLEIEVDRKGKFLPQKFKSNYNLFNKGKITNYNGQTEKLQSPLLIAEEEQTLYHYHGKFPVIFLSLKNAIGQTYEEIERNVSLALHQTFLQHKYMLRVLERRIEWDDTESGFYRILAEDDMDSFENHLRTTKNLEFKLSQLTDALEFLNRILKEYFSKSSYLLIDDYDQPFHSALTFEKFSRQDHEKILHPFNRLMMVMATGKTYFGVILTGTFCLRLTGYDKFHSEHITKEYTATNNQNLYSDLREFFAFKQHHVQFLFKKYNIEEQLANRARQWYNGYHSSSSKHNFYHPTSTLQFLHNKKITNYRPNNKYGYFMRHLFQQLPHKIKRLLKLISGQDQQILLSKHNNRQYDIPTYPYLQDEHYKCALDETFSAILRAEQYIIEKSSLNKATIPNNEVLFLISNWIISYYQQKYNINDQLLDNAANSLHEFITIEGSTESWKESLQLLYNNTIFHTCTNTSETTTESAVHSILNCVALKMQCMSKFQRDIYYHNVKTADLVIYEPDVQQAIVIELRQNHLSAKFPYDSAYNCSHVLKDSLNIHKARLVGINVSVNKTVHILAKTVSL